MKISIITINLNNLAGLKATISSVISQTYKDIEYIVIDGNSSDGSQIILEEFKDYFDYCVSEKDSGIYNAINKGIQVSTGQYILILNSGDCLYQCTTIESIIPKLKLNFDMVYGNSLDVNYPDGRKDHERKYPQELSFEFFKVNALRHQAVFLKKSVYNDLGLYDENLKIVSDWKYLFIAVGIHQITYKYIDQIICRYDRNGISSTNRILDHKERRLVIEKFFKFFIKTYDVPLSWNFKRILKNLLPFGIVIFLSKKKK